MSKISEYLSNILSSIYGKDVRQSIHDAIEQCYEDVTNGVTKSETAAANAQTAIETAAANVQSAVETANEAAQNAAAKASVAVESSQSALRAAEEARTSASNADAKAALAQKAASDVTSSVNKADAWGNATVTVEAIPPDGVADVEVTRVSDQPNNLHFFIPRGSSGVVTSDTEPEDPNVTVWIKPGEDPDPDIVQQVYILNDVKANVIMDESPKAVSHELHAQDGRLAVTLYGNTTETGSGTKSPDNPYTISGLGYDFVYVCTGKENWVKSGLALPNNRVGYWLSNGGFNDLEPSRDDNNSGNTWLYSTEMPSYHDAQKVKDYSFDCLATTSTGGKATCWFNTAFATVDEWKAYLANRYGSGNPVKIYSVKKADSKQEDDVFYQMIRLQSADGYGAMILPSMPDGAPLMGNGTVCDTVENDVLSGCNERIVINGTETGYASYKVGENGCFAFKLSIADGSVSEMYTDQLSRYTSNTFMTSGNKGFLLSNDGYIYINLFGRASTLSECKAALAANPLTVFYRSADYTPEKDLRVCKVTRRWKYTSPRATNNWVQLAAGQARFYCTGIVVGSNRPIVCEKFEGYQFYNDWNAAYSAGKFAVNIASDVLYVSSPGHTTLEDFKAWWATLGDVRVWYADDSYKTYYTDPLPLRKPSGIMPVTVTGSGETAVTYPHDTKDWGKNAASAMIGMGESSMTATKNYAIGEFIVDKNTLTLYRATTAIANGEAIVPGTNCTATTVVEQLSAIYTMLNT